MTKIEITTQDMNSVGYITRAEDAVVLKFLSQPLVRNKSVIITGAPGVGKTEFAKAFYRALVLKGDLHVKYIEYLTHSWTSDEHLFVGPNIANIASGLAAGDPGAAVIRGVLWRAAEYSKEGPVVLLLDEFEKCQPRTEALLLGFMQDGRVQGSDPLGQKGELYADLSNIYLFLTSNGTRALWEATMRRAYRYHMNYLTPGDEVKLLRKLTNAPVGAIGALVSAATNIRNKRASSVSLQEMENILLVGSDLESSDQFVTIITSILTKNPGDMSPEDIGQLAVVLFNEFGVTRSGR